MVVFEHFGVPHIGGNVSGVPIVENTKIIDAQ